MSAPAEGCAQSTFRTGKVGASGLHAGLLEASSNQVIGELAGRRRHSGELAAAQSNVAARRATCWGQYIGGSPQSKRDCLPMQKLTR
jgi:hypothetical protein